MRPRFCRLLLLPAHDGMARRSLPSQSPCRHSQPDSFIVADVDALAQSRRARRAAPPDMILLHYTGMQSRRGGAGAAVRRAKAKSRRITWCSRTAASCNACRRAARLARRRVVLGRRDRHQFALDRHRDRQSRPRIRLSGFSAAADRGGDLAVPLDPDAAAASADRSRAGAFRRRAGAQAGSGREISLGTAERIRRRPLGAAGAADVDGAALQARRRAATSVTRLQRLLHGYGYGIDDTGSYDERRREVVTAFQRHFRQARVDGIADASTLLTLRALLETRPKPASARRTRGRTGHSHDVRAASLDAAPRAPSLCPSVGRTAAPANAERRPGRKVRAPWTNGAG